MQVSQSKATLQKPLISLVILVAATLACNAGLKTATPATFATTSDPPADIVTYTPRHPSPSLITEPSPTNTPTPEAISSQRLAKYVETLAAIHNRHVNSPGIQQAAGYIEKNLLSAGGNLQVTSDWFTLNFSGMESEQRNIIARLPGSDPNAGTILVGAHYDSRTTDIHDAQSRAPGANDNASGIAVVLELAHLIARTQPRTTLLLVAFSAEEQGAQGSRHLAQILTSQKSDLKAAIILDIIGNSAGEAGSHTFRLFSAQPQDSPSRQLALHIAEFTNEGDFGLKALVQDSLDRPGRYSDHFPFSEAGVPSVRLIESLETPARQHNALDLPETIDYEYMAKITRMLVGILNNLP